MHTFEGVVNSMSTQTNSIGARIREEREALGLSKTAFAKALGIHRNTQGNYEAGEREPDAAYLAKASKAGIDIGYVLRGERASVTHQSLLHLVSVIFDALRLTPYKGEFDRIRQLAYEEDLAMWRGDGVGEDADRATAALIKKSPLVIDEGAFIELIERLEFVLESTSIELAPYDKARAILQLYSLAKTQGKPLDLQAIRSVLEGLR